MHDYDAIVIGSGAGGLAAALALARAGRRVVVFEQHTIPGGYSQSFVLRGFRFSPGVHYIGALGPGGSLRRIYEGLGVASDLVFLELDPDGYDRVFVADQRFDIPKGRDRFAARLKDRFPGEHAGIDRYFDLISRMVDELGRLRRRIARTRYSASTLSLFMAVDMDLRAAGLDSGNVWWSRTADVDAAYAYAASAQLTGDEAIPGLFFNVTTLKDPSMRSDGLHTVEAIALANVDAFARWKETAPGTRPAAYHQLKARLTERLLDAVDGIVPGLRDHTVLRALGTPLNVHFLHATRGGIYGTEKTLGNLGPFSFAVETHLRGLYQCGASTLAPGINGVTNSGLAAAAAALGCTRDDLLTATGQSLQIWPADDPAAWPPLPYGSGRA